MQPQTIAFLAYLKAIGVVTPGPPSRSINECDLRWLNNWVAICCARLLQSGGNNIERRELKAKMENLLPALLNHGLERE